eukprot:Plantae.Rhodophyta-Purpureofilum_apyrenoidigerum.ctg29061.p1 GENE.Plantae.Rhodophyta-Purpureofilum_apyrenoidigerum.ctg29061~~Plantae.Rhodophyta-Purpureofilum_apyrenoidigerum.ctg29061.p1  ORF type:complete len:398 (-),score=51.86 Plantae.Rhodophyta-Purpureofilum_apyrenoidigerum.ctg29061:173-1237(-)
MALLGSEDTRRWLFGLEQAFVTQEVIAHRGLWVVLRIWDADVDESDLKPRPALLSALVVPVRQQDDVEFAVSFTHERQQERVVVRGEAGQPLRFIVLAGLDGNIPNLQLSAFTSSEGWVCILTLNKDGEWYIIGEQDVKVGFAMSTDGAEMRPDELRQKKLQRLVDQERDTFNSTWDRAFHKLRLLFEHAELRDVYSHARMNVQGEMVLGSHSPDSVPQIDEILQQSNHWFSKSSFIRKQQLRTDMHAPTRPSEPQGFTERDAASTTTSKCEVCDLTFSRPSSARRHYVGVHLRKRTWACPHCESSFQQKCHLKAHIDAIHNSSVQYRCDLCDAMFGWRSNYLRHMRLIHGRNS